MEGNSLIQRMGEWPASTRSYFEELRKEMRMVTWPTTKQVRATTTVVIISVFAFAAYFRIVDYIVSSGITRLFRTFAQ